MKTLAIVLTDSPYVSEYAEIACKLAEGALQLWDQRKRSSKSSAKSEMR